MSKQWRDLPINYEPLPLITRKLERLRRIKDRLLTMDLGQIGASREKELGAKYLSAIAEWKKMSPYQTLETEANESIMDEQRIQELRTMPYLDYLQTPEWKAKRQQILERDGHRCRVCNGAKHLNVHHRTYERRGDEDLNDLTTLCRSCHEYFHR